MENFNQPHPICKNRKTMKNKIRIITAGMMVLMTIPLMISFKSYDKNPLDHDHLTYCGTKGCSFKTLFGEESSEGFSAFKSKEKVDESVVSGLKYLIQANVDKDLQKIWKRGKLLLFIALPDV